MVSACSLKNIYPDGSHLPEKAKEIAENLALMMISRVLMDGYIVGRRDIM